VGNTDSDFRNPKDLKMDSVEDLPQFPAEIFKKRQLQLKDIRLTETDRIIIQEKGEVYYKEQKAKRTRQWIDLVED